MRYIYDQILEKTDMTYEYLGETYKLKGVTKTKTNYYLTYMEYGREPLLVMPTFAKQFLEVCKKFDKIKDCTTDYNARLRLKRAFQQEPQADHYDLGGTTTHHYTIDYKSIQVFFTLAESAEGAHFFLHPEFTIMKDNIFGNGLDVDVRNNELLYKYCDEGL